LDDDASRIEALRRARIIADPRKFRDYALVPGHSAGKDDIFLGRFGYRLYSAADAWTLARHYEEQALQQIDAGNVRYGKADEYGLRCTIVVTVRDVGLRSGWILRSDNVLWLAMPFSGFARSTLKG
jgi:hypothetical protein